ASMLSRQEMLGSTAALLKTLAETSGIPVVVTNQVTSRMGDGSAGASHDFQHHAVAPAPISSHLPAQQSGAPAWQRSAGPGGAFDSSGSGAVVTAALGTLKFGMPRLFKP
ncbi:putative DNA repair protein RAD51, partial [Haematococcus lacustris]